MSVHRFQLFEPEENRNDSADLCSANQMKSSANAMLVVIKSKTHCQIQYILVYKCTSTKLEESLTPLMCV